MKDRKRINQLKATLIGRNQKIKHFKRLVREYHPLVIALQNSLSRSCEEIAELKRKKWYQFVKISEKP